MDAKMVRRVKMACYTSNMSMSIVGNLPPILFLTFRSMYGISYSLLGLLVLINFVTQLIIDLIFSFFSHKFNIAKAVKITPLLTAIGLLVYAVSPYIFPDNVYIGLVIGTIIFASSGGFVEVLLNPVITALPSDDTEHDLSKLHSIYAWGVVGVVIISTLFILAFGGENWQILTFIFMAMPIYAFSLFLRSELPHMETPERASGVVSYLKNKTLWICFLAIFLGGAAECTMAQWSSSYLEMAVGIPKVWGDIFGVALFSVMLGTGRTLYGKYGKNIGKVLFACAIGATVCYFTAAVSSSPIVGLIACVFTGLCVSMPWPGCIIAVTERFPNAGVFIFAMMAAGGDLGGSVGPQLVGIITDAAIAMPKVLDFAQNLGLAPEQLGMKLGMLIGMLFPLAAIPVYYHFMKTGKKG